MRFKHNHQFYDLLPMRAKSVLADEGMPWTKLPIGYKNEEFLVRVLAKDEADAIRKATRAGLVYRVIVLCRCGCEMPIAKMGQHIDTEACRRNAKRNGVTCLVPV